MLKVLKRFGVLVEIFVLSLEKVCLFLKKIKSIMCVKVKPVNWLTVSYLNFPKL